MDEVHRIADNLSRELDILEMMEWSHGERPSQEQVKLALVQAKRVKRQSTLLVRALAALRDNLQPGGTR